VLAAGFPFFLFLFFPFFFSAAAQTSQVPSWFSMVSTMSLMEISCLTGAKLI
jgi:hypothetical protein